MQLHGDFYIILRKLRLFFCIGYSLKQSLVLLKSIHIKVCKGCALASECRVNHY